MTIISVSIITEARKLGIVVETVEAMEMGMVVKAAGDGFCSKSAAENPTTQTRAKSRKKWFLQQLLPYKGSVIFALNSHF